MKVIKRFFTIIGTFLVLSFLQLSCRTAEKATVSCPEFSGNKNNKVAANPQRNRRKALNPYFRVNMRKQPIGRLVTLSRKNQGKDIVVFKHSPVQEIVLVHDIESINDLSKNEYITGLTASIDNKIIPLVRNNSTFITLKKANITEQPKDLIITQPSGCDTIVLKSDSVVICKVVEIRQDEIKYRKCDNINGPMISISKSDVSAIMYTNGSHAFFSSTNAVVSRDNKVTRKTKELLVAGFILIAWVLGLEVPLLAIIGPIFGIIRLVNIKRHPDKYKGKRFAIVSIILGLVMLIYIMAAIGSSH